MFPKITVEEGILVISHPRNAIEARKISKTAFNEQAKIQNEFDCPDASNDTKLDALRHALWSALMAQQLGEQFAKWEGDAHEGLGPYDADYTVDIPLRPKMDLNNNAVGRAIGINNPKASLSEIIAIIKNYKYEYVTDNNFSINSSRLVYFKICNGLLFEGGGGLTISPFNINNSKFISLYDSLSLDSNQRYLSEDFQWDKSGDASAVLLPKISSLYKTRGLLHDNTFLIEEESSMDNNQDIPGTYQFGSMGYNMAIYIFTTQPVGSEFIINGSLSINKEIHKSNSLPDSLADLYKDKGRFYEDITVGEWGGIVKENNIKSNFEIKGKVEGRAQRVWNYQTYNLVTVLRYVSQTDMSLGRYNDPVSLGGSKTIIFQGTVTFPALV
jgi:hypothetical protein